jgi:hypothetical protein
MKVKIMIAVLLFSLLFTACGKNKDNGNDVSPTPTNAAETGTTPAATTPPAATTAPTAAPTDQPTDGVTTASIVNNEEGFLNAISANGTWIICLLNDLTLNQEITLDGEFTNGKKDDAGKDIVQRKIALYSQDENRNITARYTLTAPKLTINSPQASIQRGTFKGDIYVNAEGFQLVDATVEGNIYFKDEQVKGSFTMDGTSKVSGTQELQQ